MKISQSFQKIQKSANAKISIVNTSKTHPQNEKKKDPTVKALW